MRLEQLWGNLPEHRRRAKDGEAPAGLLAPVESDPLDLGLGGGKDETRVGPHGRVFGKRHGIVGPGPVDHGARRVDDGASSRGGDEQPTGAPSVRFEQEEKGFTVNRNYPVILIADLKLLLVNDDAKLFTPDGVFNAPSGAALKGREAIEKALAGRIKAGWTKETVTTSDAAAAGNAVWAAGDYALAGSGERSRISENTRTAVFALPRLLPLRNLRR